ncbi:integrase [Chlorogloea sp. CCALA 695]|nr:integrase [Chlorogloea sp. CCALA 695]
MTGDRAASVRSVRVIQEISGHNDLGTLQRYLEVTPEQRRSAVSVIGF